jgi:hypothetical protein
MRHNVEVVGYDSNRRFGPNWSDGVNVLADKVDLIKVASKRGVERTNYWNYAQADIFVPPLKKYRPTNLGSSSQYVQDSSGEALLNQISGTITYNLETILTRLIQSFAAKKKTDGYIVLSNEVTIPNKGGDLVSRLFDKKYYRKRFKLAFGYEIEHALPAKSPVLKNVNIGYIYTDTPNSQAADPTPLNIVEQGYFRQMTCLGFSTTLSLKLTPMCACYPQNYSELVAWANGIYKNCYNAECQSWLSTNPSTYDTMYTGPCDPAASSQVAVVFIRTVASKNLNINVEIKQLMEKYIRERAPVQQL